MSLIDPILAEILVCPVDHGDLDQDLPASRLVCRKCGRTYPVEDGVPVMLIPDQEENPDD